MRSGLGFPVVDEHGRATHRVREQRGLSGRRRCVRCGTALHRRDRARFGVSLHQRRHQRARCDHPRPHRAPRPAVPHHVVRTAGRPAWHEHVSALRRLHGQLHRLRLRLRHAARLRQAWRAVSAGRRSGTANACCRPAGCDYALTPTHAGSSYAACFRSNADRSFPDLPPDTAWASGASDQRIFMLRGHRLVVAVANETDHPMDLAALNRVIATAIATKW